MKLSPGTTIGRYTVEEMVGEGGMATVYRVRHNELHATYALKVLHLVSESIQRRLVQEGRVQARLRHPNILPVTDILDVEGRPGLIMEYVDGPSLEIHLATRHLSLDEADQLARGILAAVAYAHSQGVVHRDLKPANILLADIGGEYHPKVADFGLVKLLGEENDSLHKTRSGIGIGTPCYMAPEQALDAAHVDERADIFSMGAILYELACGRRAFHGPNAVAIILRIAAGDYLPPEQLNPEVPARFVEAIKGALQTDRSQRIQDLPTLRAVWLGEQQHRVVERAQPDATWSDEDVLAAADGGLSDLQDLIRSIAERPAREAPRATAAPPISVEQHGSPATAVPAESMLGPPPRLPPVERAPPLDSIPDVVQPDGGGGAEGTLADDLALDLGVGDDSVSDALLSAEPAAGPAPPPPPAPAPLVHPAPATEPTDEADEVAAPSRLLPRLMLIVGLLAALGVGGTVIAIVAVVGLLSEEPAQPTELVEEPMPLAAVLAEPDTEPEEPTEPVPTVASSPSVTEPVSEVVSERAKVADPSPAAGRGALTQPVRTGMVEVSGDMVSAMLIAKNGRRIRPGKVPIGTYDLEVSFDNGKTVTRTDMVQVTDGGSISIRCSSRVENCR